MIVRITPLFVFYFFIFGLNGFSHRGANNNSQTISDFALRYAATDSQPEAGDEYLIRIEQPLREIEDERRIRKDLSSATANTGKFILIAGVLAIGLVLYNLRSN